VFIATALIWFFTEDFDAQHLMIVLAGVVLFRWLCRNGGKSPVKLSELRNGKTLAGGDCSR
jgi:hypothetical protein